MEFLINMYNTKIKINELKLNVSQDLIKQINGSNNNDKYYDLLVKHSKIVNETIEKIEKLQRKLDIYLQLKKDMEL